jgi:rifampicin phosphotransferase
MQIFELGNIPQDFYHQAGGKARGLDLLKKAGLKIADGVVLIDIKNEQDILLAADFYLGSGMEEVAVRSSSVSEDGEDFSYAGQYRSFLNIAGRDDVKNAICGCFQSTENDTVSSYSGFFSQNGNGPGNGQGNNPMSVIVQRMIRAKKAGVCFTSDPIIGEDCLLIEAVEGSCEQLVSGNVSAKQYKISMNETFKPGSQEDGILSVEEIEKIKRQALYAKDFFGTHLDTEWAIGPDGELYWLQARPITVSDEPVIDELDVQLDISRDIVTNCNIGEMLPGAVTPLSLSTSINSIDYGMRKMLVETGVYRKMEDIPPTSCILCVSNHLFINLSTLYVMEDHIIGASKDAVELSLCGRVLDEITRPVNRKSGIFIRLRNSVRYFKFFSSNQKARLKIGEIADRFKIKVKDEPSEFFSEISSNLCVMDEVFWLHYITSGHSGAMASALFMMLNRDIGDNEKTRSVISSVLEDIDDIESVDILRSLGTLAGRIIEEVPTASDLSSAELLSLVSDSGGKIKEAYDYFMKRHAHRSIREAELRSRSWKNDGNGFADYLKAMISSGTHKEKSKDSAYTNIAGLCNDYKGIKKVILKYLIGQARTGVKNREYSKSMCIKVLDCFKSSYALLAKQMVKNKLMPDEDLIFFLEHDELGKLISGVEPALIKKALMRKRRFNDSQNLRFREIYTGKPVPVVQETVNSESGMVLSGSPASRGTATGRARVVKTIEDANRLEKGEIMVASFTDIGWSPYYCLIGALITEIGSVLSHGVVVAREYSLPLVVNIEAATRIIRTGDLVFVDGSAGKVTILESVTGY